MSALTSDGGGGCTARRVLETILQIYATTDAGGMSRHICREACHQVTESPDDGYRFAGMHYVDILIDDLIEGMPVLFSADIAPSDRGGYLLTLTCRTNLEEPEWAFWEFRDFLKGLSNGCFLGVFLLESCTVPGDEPREGLAYRFRFPVPEDADLPVDVLRFLVERFLDDLFLAASKYFDNFFQAARIEGGHRAGAGGVPEHGARPESRVIPFPHNRRNRER
jgi:hypothetical protein